jgi:hypothetical protein
MWASRQPAAAKQSDLDHDFWMSQPETTRVFNSEFQSLVLERTGERSLGMQQRFVRALAVDRHCGDALAFGRRAEVQAGWPLLCLSGEASIVADRWTIQGLRVSNKFGRYSQPADKDWRGLPLRPDWESSAINTLFYAGILWAGWLLFAAPFALRRRRRIKRGLCPACAYPVGDSEVCTECGAPVMRKAVSA